MARLVPSAGALLVMTAVSAFALSPSEICRNPEIAQRCLASCEAACADAKFLSEHARYCLDNGLIGVTGARPPRADAPECQDAFRAESTSQSSADAPRSAGEPKCAEAKKLSERLKCESLGMTPACAPSPRDLEQKANLLTFEIETELTKYGELLKRDWTHVSNRQRLCAFSMAELDRNYEIATQNPKILGALQERASSIQNCQTVWERHVSPRQVEDMSAVGTDTAPKSLDGLAGGDNRRGLTPVPSPSDSLPDNLVRDMRTQLDKLKPGMARLSESVRILQNATKTIEQVARFHMLFCDPNGTVKAGK